MFKIGEFSKLTNLTIKALHHYENLGILLPEKVDSRTNYRYYSASQLAIVNQIKMLQQIGFDLKTIREILQRQDITFLEETYQLQETNIQNELSKLLKKQKMIQLYRKKSLSGQLTKEYNVEIKHIPKRNVMAIRKMIPSYNHEKELWRSLHVEFKRQHIQMDSPPLAITIYHDTEYKESNVDIEVQSSILGKHHDTDEVQFFEAPPFMMAAVTFNGDFNQMPEITQAIASWIEANHYVISGPMINISHVSPIQDTNPDNWVTTAGFIVRKASQTRSALKQ